MLFLGPLSAKIVWRRIHNLYQLPTDGLPGPWRHQNIIIHGDAFRHDPRFLHQSNGFPVSWQTIKIRAVKTGKSFEFKASADPAFPG